jgi:N-acetylglucosaminyl-diphospho-decaprenol L-rhamnosyltransferase
MSTLSIITVTHQSAEKLPGFIAAARSAAPGAETIVVDNASTDETAFVAHRHGADRVIASPANVGFGRACNLGAQQASGEWLLFANPDLAIERVPTLTAAAPSESKMYGIRAGLISEQGGSHRSSLRAEQTFVEDATAQLLYRLVPRGLARFIPKRRWPPRWASGALFLCRRRELAAVGGFDPRFFLYFEDRDLSARYRSAGYPILLESRLRGVHGHGQSSRGVDTWVREAWSLVSWIEYRGVWHGRSAAGHAARLTLSALSSIRRLNGHLQNDRSVKKAAEIAQILILLSNLEKHLKDVPDCHPLARAALDDARAVPDYLHPRRRP